MLLLLLLLLRGRDGASLQAAAHRGSGCKSTMQSQKQRRRAMRAQAFAVPKRRAGRSGDARWLPTTGRLGPNNLKSTRAWWGA